MLLELSRDKIMIVLKLSRDKIMSNSTPRSPSFLDLTLSLIISNFHLWYHNHYSFNYLVILVTSTQHALRTSHVSLRLTKRSSADTFKKSGKSSNKGEKWKKCPGTNSMVRVPKKVRFEKHCNLCKKHGGAHTTHNTSDCHRFEKN
jgi:hypothetical protein